MNPLIETARAIMGGGEGKAILRPASAEPTPALFGPPITRRISQRGAKAQLHAYGGDNAVDWVMDAGGYWATTASSASYHFETGGKKMATSDTPSDEASDKEKYPGGKVPASLEALIRQPNPFMSYEEMIELLVLDLLLVGNAYWLKYQLDPDGQPLALYRLAPPFITIHPGERRIVDTYEYRVDGVPEPLTFRPEEVIHFKLPNPNDQLYGVGLLNGNLRVYDQEIALVETMANFFEHGAKLSGVVQSDRSVPDPLLQKIRREFQTLYGGAKNAYQVAVLQRGLQFQSIQPTAAESQFRELSELGRDRVFQMFKMNPVLIDGVQSRPGLIEEAQRHFDNKHMRPFLNRLQKLISAELTHAWDGIDYKIDYEYVMPEQDRLTNAQSFAQMPGIKVREVREYLGLAPLGDERDDIVLNLPGMGVEAGGFPNGTGPDGGRPANPNNRGQFPDAGGQTQRLPNGAAAVTRPDARYQKLRKAMESGDPAELERVVQETATEGKAAALPIQFTERAIETLRKYALLPKAERAQLVAEVADLPVAANQKKLRGRVIAAVAEGVRRGYTVEQIIEGVEGESFLGVRHHLTNPPEAEDHGEAAA